MNDDGSVAGSPPGDGIEEQELRLAGNAATFEQLISGNPFGVYVVDADFRLRLVSRGARKVFGSVRPLIGRDFAEVLRVIWPEPFASEAIGRFRHTLATGEPFESPTTVERRADIGVTEAYDWRIERLAMPDGRAGVVCYFYDLSERQEWERRLRASEAERERAMTRVAAAMDVAELGIHQYEVATGAIFWDARVRSWWGVGPEEPVTYDVFMAGIHPDDRARVQARVTAALAPDGNGHYEAEYRVVIAGRPERWVRATGLTEFADGAPVRLTGAVLDITAQKAQEERLREADQRKDRFLATLSHELRNPLAPIRTAAELLGVPDLAPEQVHAARAIIRRQVGHMARLLDDLLDVARITQGKLALRRDWVPLHAVLDAAVETARPALDARRHELAVTLEPEGLAVHADPHRLAQVVANLLANAAKYTDVGGHVTLDARRTGAGLVLAVRDDGIGIPPGALDGLFDMFTQVEANGRYSDGGLGIGLALVRGIVELHGGAVSARSDGPGRGSEFVVTLPPDAVAVAAPAAAEPAAPHADVARTRVLVVDDNRDAADSLAMLVELAGHEVRVAYDGHGAIGLADVLRPDVVVLDIGMPGMNGYAVVEAMRRRPWAGAACFVAVTGWGQEGDRMEARAAGFHEHLTKPVDPRALLGFIARAGRGTAR